MCPLQQCPRTVVKRGGGGMVERRRRDPSREVRADLALGTGTLEMGFPAIWSSNFRCSSGYSAGFDNPMV